MGRALFHGTSIDALCAILIDGCLSPHFANGHAGPPGVCLTTDFAVAASHAASKAEGLAESFYGWFGLEAPSIDGAGVVLEFDEGHIDRRRIRFDDSGLGLGFDGEESEIRVLEDLSVDAALVAIHADPDRIREFAKAAAVVDARSSEDVGYGQPFRRAVRALLDDPRLRTERAGRDLRP